jgi:hypothetical protein
LDNKRRKEQTRKQKQADKEARKQKRLAERPLSTEGSGETDPDLAGLVAGPQPPRED